MNKELYALLKLYQNKKLDDKFIYKAFDIMMKYEIIDKYVSDFNIINNDKDILGTYSNEQRIIELNKKKIINNDYFENNKLLTLYVLRHELEHAKNLQRLYEKNNDIKTKVIRYSLREYAMNHNLYYGSSLDNVDPFILRARKYDTYDIDPGERIADIKGWKFIINLIKNQRRTNDILMARIMLYNAYIKGYKDNGYYLEPPTYEYLLALGLYHEHYLLKKQFYKKNYNLNTRLLCGLPISYKEYNNSTLTKVKLQRKKQNYRNSSTN